MQPVNHFNFLPNELIEKIFYNLDGPSIVQNKSVCKNWNELLGNADAAAFWKQLSLRDFPDCVCGEDPASAYKTAFVFRKNLDAGRFSIKNFDLWEAWQASESEHYSTPCHVKLMAVSQDHIHIGYGRLGSFGWEYQIFNRHTQQSVDYGRVNPMAVLTCSPSSNTFHIGDPIGYIISWNPTNYANKQDSSITSLFSTHNRLISATQNCKIIIWLDHFKDPISFSIHAGGVVTSLAYSDQEKELIAGFQDGVIKTFAINMDTFAANQILAETVLEDRHIDQVTALALLPPSQNEGEQLVSASKDGYIKRWELKTKKFKASTHLHNGNPIKILTTASNFQRIISVCEGGIMNIFHRSFDKWKTINLNGSLPMPPVSLVKIEEGKFLIACASKIQVLDFAASDEPILEQVEKLRESKISGTEH